MDTRRCILGGATFRHGERCVKNGNLGNLPRFTGDFRNASARLGYTSAMPNKAKWRELAKRFGRDRSGVAAVELGLVAPMLAALLIPMIDLGVGSYDKMRVQNAAAAGAQWALANPTAYSATSIQTAAQSASSLGTSVTVVSTQTCNCLSGSTLGAAVACANTCPDGSTPGTFVGVTTTYSYSLLFTYPTLSNPMSLTGVTVVRTQ
jgi:Flp pilus assembly protein TadG